MLRRLLFFIFPLVLFSFALIFPRPAQAQAAIGAAAAVETFSDIKSYCQARTGNVMNLETWYSGKCPDALSPLTGSGNEGQYRGFSDIVLLDLMIKIIPENPSLLGLGDAAIPGITKIMASMQLNPPASGTQYLAHVNDNFKKANLVEPAYAQETQPGAGLGFNKLLPILPAWSGMRNISYIMFILIFVLYGFMIMFRTKINAQTVVNFELAIPKLVFTLLLITFSYAIAGFIIDLGVLIPVFISQILHGAGLINLGAEPLFTTIRSLIPGADAIAVQSDTAHIDYLTGTRFFGANFLGLQAVWETIIGHSVSDMASLVTGLPSVVYQILIIGSGLGILLKFILVIAIFYVMLKIFLMQLQAYAMIVFNIILAPIILLGNVLPGSTSFDNWLRGLLANVSVFPSTAIMFMLAISLLGTSSPIASGDMWVPSSFGGRNDLLNIPGQPQNNAQGVSAMLAFAILFLAPKAAEMIRDALKAPAFKYGSALAEPIKQGIAGTNWAGQRTDDYMQSHPYVGMTLNQIPGLRSYAARVRSASAGVNKASSILNK